MKTFHVKPVRLALVTFSLLTLVFPLMPTTPCLAEVSTDGSLGVQTTLPGPDFSVTSDLGQIRGTNLFHSFREFSIQSGESAVFSGPTFVENIISRVTGGEVSYINGLLRSTIDQADFFLLNPSGVIFGPWAALDIPGSFHAGTADYLRFDDGSVFYADPGRVSVLSVAQPEAFGFLTANPADITVDDSWLYGADGEVLSLVGGNLNIVGGDWGARIIISGGKLQLVAVGKAGEVNIDSPEVLSSPESESGTIHISDAFVSTYGPQAGTAVIKGGRIFVDNSIVFSGGSDAMDATAPAVDIEALSQFQMTGGSVYGVSAGSGAGGNIRLKADDLALNAASKIIASAEGGGRGGNISIHSDTLSLEDKAYISALSEGTGIGGDIQIVAGDTISLRNSSSIKCGASDQSVGGDMTIRADTLTLEDDADISSSAKGSGNSGFVYLNISDLISLKDSSSIRSSASDQGLGSEVSIYSNALTLEDDSRISSSSEADSLGGYLWLNIADLISVKDSSSIVSMASDQGNGGIIAVAAETLALGNEAHILSSSEADSVGGTVWLDIADLISLEDASSIASMALDQGKGGNMIIASNTLVLEDDADILSLSNGTGAGGFVRLDIADRISLKDSSSIKSMALDQGAGGFISVASDALALENDAVISSSSKDRSVGGSVDLEIADQMSLKNSSSVKSTALNEGVGGDISIASNALSLADDADIYSSSGGSGTGGSISFDIADQMSLQNSSSVGSTASEQGIGGDISIVSNALSLGDEANILSFSADNSVGGFVWLDIADHVSLQDSSSVESLALGQGIGGIIAVASYTLALADEADILSLSNDSSIGGFVWLNIVDRIFLKNSSSVASLVFDQGSGGAIEIAGRSLTLEDWALVESRSWENGTCGAIQIATTDSVTIAGQGNGISETGVQVISKSSNAAGAIDVSTSSLALSDGGYLRISSAGKDEAGALTVNADQIEMNDSYFSSYSAGTGKGANIIVDTQTLTLKKGADIWAGASESSVGGSIQINATDSVKIGSKGTNGDLSSVWTQTSGAATAGEISVFTEALELYDGGTISSNSADEGDSGLIIINTRILEMDDGIIDSNGGAGDSADIIINTHTLEAFNDSGITTMAGGAGNGGNLKIAAENILIDGSVISAGTEGAGNSGDIDIETSQLTIRDGATIGSETLGEGDGGTISISAVDLDVIGGFREKVTGISAGCLKSGNAGNVYLNVTGSLTLSNGGTIGTDAVEGSSGNAGDIEINAAEVSLDNGAILAYTAGAGDGGNILVNTDHLTVRGTGGITCETAGTGSGGNLRIIADSLLIDGAGAKTTGLFASSTGMGRAGSIFLDIGDIRLQNGGRISTEVGTQKVESVMVAAASAQLLNDQTAGTDGKINITANNLQLLNKASIMTKSLGAANAGDVDIDIAENLFSSGSTITTEAVQADGGNISIKTGNFIYFINGGVTASVGGGFTTKGGNIDLQARYAIFDHSSMKTNAIEGHGGDIDVMADTFLTDAYSIVDASSELGIDGIVDINAPLNNLDGSLKPLPKDFSSVTSLLKEPCEVRMRGGAYGSFVVKGRDALPLEPGSLQISPPLEF